MNHRLWVGRKGGKAREMLRDYETTRDGEIRRQVVLTRLRSQGTGYKALEGLTEYEGLVRCYSLSISGLDDWITDSSGHGLENRKGRESKGKAIRVEEVKKLSPEDSMDPPESSLTLLGLKSS